MSAREALGGGVRVARAGVPLPLVVLVPLAAGVVHLPVHVPQLVRGHAQVRVALLTQRGHRPGFCNVPLLLRSIPPDPLARDGVVDGRGCLSHWVGGCSFFPTRLDCPGGRCCRGQPLCPPRLCRCLYLQGEECLVHMLPALGAAPEPGGAHHVQLACPACPVHFGRARPGRHQVGHPGAQVGRHPGTQGACRLPRPALLGLLVGGHHSGEDQVGALEHLAPHVGHHVLQVRYAVGPRGAHLVVQRVVRLVDRPQDLLQVEQVVVRVLHYLPLLEGLLLLFLRRRCQAVVLHAFPLCPVLLAGMAGLFLAGLLHNEFDLCIARNFLLVVLGCFASGIFLLGLVLLARFRDRFEFCIAGCFVARRNHGFRFRIAGCSLTGLLCHKFRFGACSSFPSPTFVFFPASSIIRGFFAIAALRPLGRTVVLGFVRELFLVFQRSDTNRKVAGFPDRTFVAVRRFFEFSGLNRAFGDGTTTAVVHRRFSWSCLGRILSRTRDLPWFFAGVVLLLDDLGIIFRSPWRILGRNTHGFRDIPIAVLLVGGLLGRPLGQTPLPGRCAFGFCAPAPCREALPRSPPASPGPSRVLGGFLRSRGSVDVSRVLEEEVGLDGHQVGCVAPHVLPVVDDAHHRVPAWEQRPEVARLGTGVEALVPGQDAVREEAPLRVQQ
uniref:Putative secreted protein n=1 Tax=Ixodes ricinus TaxID=34613 RepID=A0A6B0VDV2_IXORI